MLKILISTTLILFSIALHAESARIAVASNFSPTLKPIVEEFKRESGHTLILVSGSTGKLFAQIEHGAPFHGFLSADSLRVEQLLERGLALAGTEFIYARGRLAYWAPKQQMHMLPPNFSHIKTLAIANPKLAPYGKAAKATLAALLNKQTPTFKTVQGSNITQALQYVASGSVDAGLVSLSQLLQIEESERGYWWVVPQKYHEPLTQKAALLVKGKSNRAAIDFFQYLKTEKVTTQIELSGYTQ